MVRVGKRSDLVDYCSSLIINLFLKNLILEDMCGRHAASLEPSAISGTTAVLHNFAYL